MRESFHLRARLMPYVYTAMAQAARDSVPFIRPMYLEHPGVDAAYRNGQQYYFGDDLLVAPVAMPGRGANRVAWQHVWFPGGTWYQYFTGERYDGERHVVVAADINEFPLFARGGVPIPEQPYTARPTSAPLAGLVLRCFPGADGKTGESTLYEDDGLTSGYQRGEAATTALSDARRGDEVTVRIAPTVGTFAGQRKTRAITLLLPNTSAGMIVSPAAAKLTYDAATATNRVELPEVPITSEVVVTVRVADLPAATAREQARTRRLDGLVAKPFAQLAGDERAALSPDVVEAIAAIDGAALVAVNPQPHLYGNDIELTYFNPADTSPAKATLAFKSWSQPVAVKDGQPIDLREAAKAIAPEDVIQRPGADDRLTLRIDGQPPIVVGVRSLSVAYALGNLSLAAKITTSTGRGEGAIDGVADGGPQSTINEWGGAPEDKSPWVRMNWQSPVTVTRVLLYDRPNPDDQVLAGKLSFSDGSSIDVGELQNDGGKPASFEFPAKTVSWARFDITRSSGTTKNAGLSEFGVFAK